MSHPYPPVPGLMARSAAFYPVTACYLVAVTVLYVVVDRAIGFRVGAAIMAALFAFILLVSMWHELRTVHKLVNSQRDELLARIDQLSATLHAAGVAIPSDREL